VTERATTVTAAQSPYQGGVCDQGHSVSREAESAHHIIANGVGIDLGR
jgi:hypothetical protein